MAARRPSRSPKKPPSTRSLMVRLGEESKGYLTRAADLRRISVSLVCKQSTTGSRPERSSIKTNIAPSRNRSSIRRKGSPVIIHSPRARSISATCRRIWLGTFHAERCLWRFLPG